MQLAVLGGFVVAGLAPLLHGWFGPRTARVMALLPAAIAAWLLAQWPVIAAGETLWLEWAWVPGLDITLTFMIDGLAWLFAMLISVIGTLVLVYAGDYLHGHRDLPRFLVVITAFMMSMLGLVLADNLVTLFVFWELTSITSYLLIGFNHTDLAARKSAQQGLFVTVGGGLALLAGFSMLALAGDSWSLAELNTRGEQLKAHALYTPLLVCVLLGAFTKSAQFPFHFWLPNAMAAPTPVSAYLHSATMVKAGVYLLARLHPALGGTESWVITLSLVGALTMATGAFLAIQHTNVKKLLAYSTVMALGALTMLLGIGTEYALTAFVVFLLGHSLYKGALFLVAGGLEHGTGTKNILAMGGLSRAMPLTALLAAVSALSLAGLPPLFGFIGKELMLESVLGAPFAAGLLTLLAVVTAVLVVAAAGVVALRPFYGACRETPKPPHDPSYAMLAGPAVLGLLSLLFGVIPGLPSDALISAAASSLAAEPVEAHLALWHGLNLPLGLSLLAIAGGGWLYLRWDKVRQRMQRLDAPLYERGPEAGYDGLMAALERLAVRVTRVLQHGYLRHYLSTTALTLVAVVGYTLLTRYDGGYATDLDVRFYELAIAALLVAAVLFACRTQSRLAAVVSAGVVGFAVALFYILFSAPDPSITQILVETLTVILLVLVLFKLPEFVSFSSPRQRRWDAVVASLVGLLVTTLLLVVIDQQ
ncbi:MAG: proton-conducting transporter membrane subunit, partial [Halomonas sp.]